MHKLKINNKNVKDNQINGVIIKSLAIAGICVLVVFAASYYCMKRIVNALKNEELQISDLANGN